jgi:large subunit ribosomal protein L17
MRHRVQDKKFNRTSNERKALLNGLLRSLAEQGEITTTKAKAKELKRLADRMISQAQENTLASRRILHRTFGKRDVVNTLVERVAPALADRKSGFTRLTVVGHRRGDNTEMVKIEFVNKAEKVGDFKSNQPKPARAEKKVKAEKPAKAAKPAAKKAPVKKAEAKAVKVKKAK